jgi:hypothetical protein
MLPFETLGEFCWAEEFIFLRNMVENPIFYFYNGLSLKPIYISMTLRFNEDFDHGLLE